jgi:hypothetical protein
MCTTEAHKFQTSIAAPKLKRPPPYSFWKNISRAWINVREGLTKADPTSLAEILR